MKIGNIFLENSTILAPLAGITNLPFRLLIKEMGCGLVCSEMVSSNGLVHKSQKTFNMLDSTALEKPVSFQIFGADPQIMADAACLVQEAGADILDINFGCSVRKIIKSGSGSALMKNPNLAQAILKAVRNAISIPLTIKIRSGWDTSGDQAIYIAQMAEACGVDAIAVHPRTATQGFRGISDWSLIAAVKKAVSIPVIGNGDIVSPEDGVKMLAETKCDGVMVGRAAIGNPWIFHQITTLEQGNVLEPINLDMRFQAMIHYLRSSVKYIGEIHACRMMRSRLGWFVKGLSHSSHFRESIKHIDTEEDALCLIAEYKASLEATEA